MKGQKPGESNSVQQDLSSQVSSVGTWLLAAYLYRRQHTHIQRSCDFQDLYNPMRRI